MAKKKYACIKINHNKLPRDWIKIFWKMYFFLMRQATWQKSLCYSCEWDSWSSLFSSKVSFPGKRRDERTKALVTNSPGFLRPESHPSAWSYCRLTSLIHLKLPGILQLCWWCVISYNTTKCYCVSQIAILRWSLWLVQQLYKGTTHKLLLSIWHPTPVSLPGESHGQRRLVGCSPWGC